MDKSFLDRQAKNDPTPGMFYTLIPEPGNPCYYTLSSTIVELLDKNESHSVIRTQTGFVFTLLTNDYCWVEAEDMLYRYYSDIGAIKRNLEDVLKSE